MSVMLRSTSRADRLGFIVFVVLASLLAVLLINDGGSKTSEAADVQTLGAPVAAAAEVPVVPTTAPIRHHHSPAAKPMTKRRSGNSY